MSTAEDLMDDARREAAGQEIEREYDDAASTAARGICRRRHHPHYRPVSPGSLIRQYWPHTPGACDLAGEILDCLLEAKRPDGPHMTNPPVVGMENMIAFAQRVAERFG